MAQRQMEPDAGIAFRVRPGRLGSRDYFAVFIYSTRAGMHRAHRREYGGKAYRTAKLQAVASCGPVRVGPQRSHCRGNIRFHAGAMNAGIVAHEMGHAALYWVLREVGMRIHPGDKRRVTAEEVFCCTLQSLVNQFWGGVGRLQRRGLIRARRVHAK